MRLIDGRGSNTQILGQLRGRLHGLLVVTSSVAPVDLVSALLRSGARCVICKDAAAAIPEATAAADFFETFYSHLFAGTTIMSALAAAGGWQVHLLLHNCLASHLEKQTAFFICAWAQ